MIQFDLAVESMSGDRCRVKSFGPSAWGADVVCVVTKCERALTREPAGGELSLRNHREDLKECEACKRVELREAAAFMHMLRGIIGAVNGADAIRRGEAPIIGEGDPIFYGGRN